MKLLGKGSEKMIPLINLKKQFASIHNEIIDAITQVLVSGEYILGPKVEELEDKVAKRLGVKHAIAVGNGTDALVITLDAYGIGYGDEVITTPFTFFATAEAITRVGATPVFVDIDPQTYNIDPSKIVEKITPKTKAIIPVHLFGLPAEMDSIQSIAKEQGLLLIEDAAQAFGATYKDQPIGSIGDAACFSFFPTKNLGTLGDGGMVTTSDDSLAEKIRRLRVHGSRKKYFHQEVGYNSRLDEIHAAVLLVCLEHIDRWNNQRGIIADYYRSELKSVSTVELPVVLDDRTHIYHLFCLKSPDRESFIALLKKASIQTGIYYPQCLHLQDAYRDLDYKIGDLPIAEGISKQLFAIPMHPFLSKEEQGEVIHIIKQASESR